VARLVTSPSSPDPGDHVATPWRFLNKTRGHFHDLDELRRCYAIA